MGKRYTNASQTMRNCSAIAAQLRNRIGIASQSLRNQCEKAAQLLGNRFAIAAKLVRNDFEKAAQSPNTIANELKCCAPVYSAS
jgi:hypothetical protein